MSRVDHGNASSACGSSASTPSRSPVPTSPPSRTATIVIRASRTCGRATEGGLRRRRGRHGRAHHRTDRLAATILTGQRPRAPSVDQVGRVEQPGHEGEHDAVHEHELVPDAPGLVVVEEVLPPVPDDVLRRVDVTTSEPCSARRALMYLMSGALMSRYGEAITLSGTLMFMRVPLFDELLGGLVVDRDVHRLDRSRAGPRSRSRAP